MANMEVEAVPVIASPTNMIGIMRYGAVFVDSKAAETLIANGLGAKRMPGFPDGISEDKNSVTGDQPEQPSRLGGLQLFNEEAFYMHSNGRLQVKTTAGAILEAEDLWQIFLKQNPCFPVKYKAYSFFKQKGFVLKTAIHYGLDYAVYRSVPMLCHSELCLLVLDATGRSSCQVGWRQLSTLTRVIPDVMKMLILCYVCTGTDTLSSSDENTIGIDCSDDEGDVDPAIPFTPRARPPAAETIAKVFSFDNSNNNHESTVEDSASASARDIDWSTPACLDNLCVRPVTVIVRRTSGRASEHESAQALLARTRNSGMLKTPRGKEKKARNRSKVTAAAVSATSTSIVGTVASSALSAAVKDAPEGGVSASGSAAEIRRSKPVFTSEAVTHAKDSMPAPFLSPAFELDDGGVLQPKKRKARRDPTEIRTKSKSKHDKVWKALSRDSGSRVQQSELTQEKNNSKNKSGLDSRSSSSSSEGTVFVAEDRGGGGLWGILRGFGGRIGLAIANAKVDSATISTQTAVSLTDNAPSVPAPFSQPDTAQMKSSNSLSISDSGGRGKGKGAKAGGKGNAQPSKLRPLQPARPSIDNIRESIRAAARAAVAKAMAEAQPSAALG